MSISVAPEVDLAARPLQMAAYLDNQGDEGQRNFNDTKLDARRNRADGSELMTDYTL